MNHLLIVYGFSEPSPFLTDWIKTCLIQKERGLIRRIVRSLLRSLRGRMTMGKALLEVRLEIKAEKRRKDLESHVET